MTYSIKKKNSVGSRPVTGESLVRFSVQRFWKISEPRSDTSNLDYNNLLLLLFSFVYLSNYLMKRNGIGSVAVHKH